MTTNQIELGYLAGMLDGEGSITILACKSGSYTSHTVRVSMSNTNREALERIAEHWGGNVTLFNDRREQRGWKRCWFWYTTGPKAIALLKLVRPHLTIKLPQCEIALQMEALAGKHGKRIPPDVAMQRANLKLQINELNRRGANADS